MKKRTWRDDCSKLNAHIPQRIGALKADAVTKRDVIKIIDHIAIERKAPVQADRTIALLSSIFNWGRDEALVHHNPADRIRKRSSRKRRNRMLTNESLFREALALSGGSAFVFPSEVRLCGDKAEIPLHADTVTDEVASAREQLRIAPADDGEEAVLHILRHLVKTEMKSLGIDAEVRKRIQSHRSKTATADMDDWYDHADYYDADRAALELWEQRLKTIISAQDQPIASDSSL